jgi:hypothetical protein
MPMLMTSIIKAGLGQQPCSPIHNGIINRPCSTDENLHALLGKCLDGLGPKTAHDHDVNSFFFEHIRRETAATHMVTPVGQDLHIFSIEIHQCEGRSTSEVLRNSLFHSTTAHGGYTDLHLMITALHRHSRPLVLRQIPGSVRRHRPGRVLRRLCPSRLQVLHVPCQHGAEQMLS